MITETALNDPWKEGETRENRFCFIGKNLNRTQLEAALMKCVVPDDTVLRFKVGDTVMCRMEEGWRKGKVLRLWSEGNPYRVLMNKGWECSAPEDSDTFIRAAKPPRAASRP
eukprot:CAMPEP_0172206754 /NCGR_PEP_ID=MMETSP1050-20130122/33408_1 /TAXON_ID=233186 /ORGANISM="Cryptomonas curvata, Strain CCAP979/52" /LENGTH=111 /DNA_ID=CAMNT_0012885901 /DNA_START=24 /DNA_END=356 /DNA_ORIENTATION=+